jgi:hypothetical protein
MIRTNRISYRFSWRFPCYYWSGRFRAVRDACSFGLTHVVQSVLVQFVAYRASANRYCEARDIQIVKSLGMGVLLLKEIQWVPVKIQSFHESWRTAVNDAGFPALLFHDLRRSAVRNMVENVGKTCDGPRSRKHKSDSPISNANAIPLRSSKTGKTL